MTLDAQHDHTVSQLTSFSDQSHPPSPAPEPVEQPDLESGSADADVTSPLTPTNEFEGFGSFSG